MGQSGGMNDPLQVFSGELHRESKHHQTSCSSFTDLDSDTSNDSYDFSPLNDMNSIEGFLNPFDSDLRIDSPSDVTSHPHMAPDSGSLQTVSPKDIMGDGTSAPASTTFTDLTSPGTSYVESPLYMVNSLNTSPLFMNDNLGAEADSWPSLFEDDLAQSAGGVMSGNHRKSFAAISGAQPMTRTDSSPGQSSSRSSQGGRHSFTAGVNPRRRDRPLKDIKVDNPNDAKEVKRVRNTLAARKSRARRAEREDDLVEQVDELKRQVDHWKKIALGMGSGES